MPVSKVYAIVFLLLGCGSAATSPAPTNNPATAAVGQSPEEKAVMAVVESAAAKNAVYWQSYADNWASTPQMLLAKDTAEIKAKLTTLEADIKGASPSVSVPARDALVSQIAAQKKVLESLGEVAKTMSSLQDSLSMMKESSDKVSKDAAGSLVGLGATILGGDTGFTLNNIKSVDSAQAELKKVLPQVTLIDHSKLVGDITKIKTDAESIAEATKPKK